MYHAFPLSLKELQTFQWIEPLIFNITTLDELTLKVQDGSSAGRNGNRGVQRVELGGLTPGSLQWELPKRELLPKPPLSPAGRTPV